MQIAAFKCAYHGGWCPAIQSFRRDSQHLAPQSTHSFPQMIMRLRMSSVRDVVLEPAGKNKKRIEKEQWHQKGLLGIPNSQAKFHTIRLSGQQHGMLQAAYISLVQLQVHDGVTSRFVTR